MINKMRKEIVFVITLMILIALFSGAVSALECKTFYYSPSKMGNEIHCVADDGLTYEVDKKEDNNFGIKKDNQGNPEQSPNQIDLIHITDPSKISNIVAGETPELESPEDKPEKKPTPEEIYHVNPLKEPGINTATFMYDENKEDGTPPKIYKFKYGDYYECTDQVGSSCDVDSDNPEASWKKLDESDTLIDTFNGDPAFQEGIRQNLGFLGKLSLPLELSWMEARGVGQAFFSLGVDFGLWEDDWIGDFMGVNDLLATEFGQHMTLNFGDSICRYSTDYDNLAAGGGVLMPPGATSPSAWITGDAQEVRTYDGAGNILKAYTYRISVSVSVSGLTEHSAPGVLLEEDEECKDTLSFYITVGNKQFDENGDDAPDLIELDCTGSYSRTGVSALLVTSEKLFNEVCIDFEDTSDLHWSVKQVLDSGSRVCNDVDFQAGGCPYCGLTSEDLEGIDMGVEEEEEEEEEPEEPAGPPQLV